MLAPDYDTLIDATDISLRNLRFHQYRKTAQTVCAFLCVVKRFFALFCGGSFFRTNRRRENAFVFNLRFHSSATPRNDLRLQAPATRNNLRLLAGKNTDLRLFAGYAQVLGKGDGEPLPKWR